MSHEPLVQPRRNGQSAAEVVSTPDPEVVPKAERRKFTAEYKQRILGKRRVYATGRDWCLVAPGRALPLTPGQMA